MNDKRLTPYECEVNATAHEKRGEWEQAEQWWNKAIAATIGHKKRQRYEDRRDECLKRQLDKQCQMWGV